MQGTLGFARVERPSMKIALWIVQVLLAAHDDRVDDAPPHSKAEISLRVVLALSGGSRSAL